MAMAYFLKYPWGAHQAVKLQHLVGYKIVQGDKNGIFSSSNQNSEWGKSRRTRSVRQMQNRRALTWAKAVLGCRGFALTARVCIANP